MKYYLYISKTKVEMLYPQIPPSLFKGKEAEVKFNVGVVSTSFKGSKPEASGELVAKLLAVTRYINAHEEVGSIDEPCQYISGVLPLRYGIVTEYASDIAFFGGEFEGKLLGLIGSSSSLVGQAELAESNHAPFYYTLRFLNHIADKDSEINDQPPYYSFKEAIGIALTCIPTNIYELEFMARVLHKESDLLIATPLYVAMASESGKGKKKSWWKFWR